MFFKQKEEKQPCTSSFEHNIEKGDHLIRWTHVLLWPVQVHAICIGSCDASVTLVDFGLTAQEQKQQQQSSAEEEEQNRPAVSAADQAMMCAAENHRKAMVGPERIHIVTLTEEKHMRQWRKVEYGKRVDRKFWEFWKKNNEEEEEASEEKEEEEEEEETKENGVGAQEERTKAMQEPKKAESIDEEEDHYEEFGIKEGSTTGEISPIKQSWWNSKVIDSVDENDECKNLSRSWWRKEATSNETEESELNESSKKQNGWQLWKSKENNEDISENVSATSNEESIICENDATDHTEEKPAPPSLPKSDPTIIVLARVRYLLTNPQVLPPHNVFHSNSECIAVWCKTGRWSTLQASIFLHSTAAGNLKSAVTLAATAATATTTVSTTSTAPAWGIAGWLGFTTTSTSTATVGFLSLHPWLVPLLAGYGIVAVGTPVVLLMKAKKRWEEVTQTLTDGFWEWADSDIYVEAIQSWSDLKK